MLLKNFTLVIVMLAFGCVSLTAQKITYSEPDREDRRSIDFDIIGKINDHILVYKNYRNDYTISLFDNDMNLIDKQDLSFLPGHVISTDLITYRDYFYFLYQYQKRSIVYCMAAKIDGSGKIIGDPKLLDTTSVSFLADNKIYSFVNSEDKQKIGVIKINTRNDKNYAVTTAIFDNNLNLINKSRVDISMPDNNDFLTEFNIDNNGDIVFVKASGTSKNDNINKLTLVTKKEAEDTVTNSELDVSGLYLDDIRVKVDNANKNYLITSFNSKSKRGNVDGLYCCLWSKTQQQVLRANNIAFSQDLRNDAKSEGNAKYAFNDYFLQNIVMRRDGGFVIAAESVYSSSRGNTYNRWDYLYGSPYWYPSNYYMYSNPFSNYYYPWWRGNGFMNQNTRYFADNIAVFSFDSSVNTEWVNIIKKSQYDDNTDDFIGYGSMNTGGEIHFLYNQAERRTLLLTDQNITADGHVNRSPTIRNLDKGYQFMPRFAKQVGAKQLIVPCEYKNYICFAKIDF